jgi:SAM-dependent methyltransferase
MYSQSARVYDRLCRHKDYAAATAALRQILARVAPDASSLLDVACGTGQHLRLLRDHFRVEGLDVSPEMLAVAREHCPGVPLHQATLVDFDLARTFDVVVCLFGSIGYAVSASNMRLAVCSMARHVRPGGALIVEPWLSPERFVAGRPVFDCVDDPDLKVARMYVTRREGAVSVFDSDYLVGTAGGVTHFTERQELGLFTDDEYRAAMSDARLEVVDTTGSLFGYGLYVCRAAPQTNG